MVYLYTFKQNYVRLDASLQNPVCINKVHVVMYGHGRQTEGLKFN